MQNNLHKLKADKSREPDRNATFGEKSMLIVPLSRIWPLAKLLLSEKNQAFVLAFQVKLLIMNCILTLGFRPFKYFSWRCKHGKVVNAFSLRVLRRLLFSLFSVELYKVCFRKMPENSPYSTDGVVITGCLLSRKES